MEQILNACAIWNVPFVKFYVFTLITFNECKINMAIL